MHALIAGKLDEIIRLCRDHGVRRLEILGSAARGTDFDVAKSDVDFLVEFEERPASRGWASPSRPFLAAMSTSFRPEETQARDCERKSIGIAN